MTGPTTVELDARTTRPVSFKVPDATATPTRAGMMYSLNTPETGITLWSDFTSFDNVRTAYQGSPVTGDSSLYQQWSAHWKQGATEYNALAGTMVPELATGYSKTYTTKNMALVKVRIGSSAPGVDGIVKAYGELANGGVDPAFTVQPLTGTRKVYLSTDDDAVWNIVAGVLGEKDPAGDRQIEAAYSLDTARRFEPGTTHTETFHAGVMGPQIKPGDGLVRDGDNLYGSLALVSDGPGHPGFARYAGATTTIHRDGVLYAKEDAAIDERFFALPPESATYKVATTINRNPVVYRAGTRIDASWTFTSARTETPATLPVSTVRFQPQLALDSTVVAGSKQTFPVVVQGAAAGAGLKSLRVTVSYDNEKWLPAKVTAGKITVNAPAKGKAISLRAVVTDTSDNESTVTIHNAFFGR